MADVIDIGRFLDWPRISPDELSSLIAKSRDEAVSDEADVEACVIAFADALPINYETLTDDDLGELVRLAGESESFRAILHKLTGAISA